MEAGSLTGISLSDPKKGHIYINSTSGVTVQLQEVAFLVFFGSEQVKSTIGNHIFNTDKQESSTTSIQDTTSTMFHTWCLPFSIHPTWHAV